MGKTGRPRKEVDWEEFDKLCRMQCTETEIASWFDMSIDTLNLRCKGKYKQTFTDVYAQKREAGFCSLRRSQFKRATEDESDTMLIWLGKQYLKQQDKRDVDVNFLNNPAWLEIQQALIMVLQAHPDALEDTKRVLEEYAGNGRTDE